MAIFECQVRGTDKVRLVKAATAAQARDHIVSAKAISAERMAEVMSGDVKLEVAVAPSTDPASHAPGGENHRTDHGDAPINDVKPDEVKTGGKSK